MAVNGIHDPQICTNIKLKAANKIHRFMMTSMTHLTWVTVSEGIDRPKPKFKFILPVISKLLTPNFGSFSNT